MKLQILTALAEAADWTNRLWRARKSYVPQRASDVHAEDTGYVGRRRFDRVQQWTDRVYGKPGATHNGDWYDEPTGPWPILTREMA